jgi:hypothetical protein
MKEKNGDLPCCGYKDERWQPAFHQRYFVILGDGSVQMFRWSGAPFDYKAWQFGNCFKTHTDAEHARAASTPSCTSASAETYCGAPGLFTAYLLSCTAKEHL